MHKWFPFTQETSLVVYNTAAGIKTCRNCCTQYCINSFYSLLQQFQQSNGFDSFYSYGDSFDRVTFQQFYSDCDSFECDSFDSFNSSCNSFESVIGLTVGQFQQLLVHVLTTLIF